MKHKIRIVNHELGPKKGTVSIEMSQKLFQLCLNEMERVTTKMNNREATKVKPVLKGVKVSYVIDLDGKEGKRAAKDRGHGVRVKKRK